MGASSSDLFGADPQVEAATPGSYGKKPSGYRLPEDTRLGSVRLQVADLERSLEFYERVLGLNRLTAENGRAALATHGDENVLVQLEERAGVRSAGRGLLGLFHFAILLPDRASLGRFVRHLGAIGAHAGAGDHIVSEAFYLRDPDGLGIEVYADRSRSTWKRIGRELMLATDPVDVASLVDAAGDDPWNGMPAGTTMGHVHLHVGNVNEASAYFSDALGFDLMTWSYPGALFLGAGGYHHHLGTNEWAGPDATAPGEGDARLLEWNIIVPSANDVEEVARSVSNAGYPIEEAAGGDAILVDPWGTKVRIRRAPRRHSASNPAAWRASSRSP